MSNALNLTDSRIKVGDEYINKVYHKGSLVYNYELKEVQVGGVTTVKAPTTTITRSTLLPWKSYTVLGQDGTSATFDTVHMINGQQIGTKVSSTTKTITQTVNHTYYRGTKSTAEYTKLSGLTHGNYASTTEFPLRKKVDLYNYVLYNNHEAVVTYRVTNGGQNGSGSSGSIRFKQVGAGVTTNANFTPHIIPSDVDSSGNPLCVITAQPSNTTNRNYGEYLQLFFSSNISNVYDISIYFKKPSSEPIIYIVQDGDSWWGIWFNHRADLNTTQQQIYDWNNANAGTVIHPGNKIIVGWT